MRTCITLSIVCLLLGCGQPQFSNREEFGDLKPYAQDYVQQVLETHFGTPTEMVVWDRLPLDAHLATGTIAEAGERDLVLDLRDPHHEIESGAEILWQSGDLVGTESGWIRSWDEEAHQATLDVKLTSLPSAGDEVILGPGAVLSQGRLLYAEHCQHCHGVSGDGNGPTAPYLTPKPRDYRRGIFKFTSTQASERAHRDDLARIIENGIPGTYMPSFKLLTNEEMASIVEYVVWLSMRGELEYLLVKFLSDSYSNEAVKERVADGNERKKAGAEEYDTYASIQNEFDEAVNDPDEIPAELDLFVELIASGWSNAQEESAVIVPESPRVTYDAESIARGRQLYLSADLNCIACHGEAGRGDGPQTYSITKDLATGQDNEKPGLYDNWGNEIAPRNLHAGVYRGGRRPIDLYDRVHAGIKGTPMPAFGAKMKAEQIWDIVNYVYSVPFEEQVAGSGLSDPAAPEVAAAE